jgi:hypothetical protein
MNVITTRPVYDETMSNCCGNSSFDDYSYARGKKKVRSGQFKEKAKQGYQRVKEAGGLSFLENVLGLNQQATNTQLTDTNVPDANLNVQTKQPMSTTTKVLIGVGVVGAVGLVLYFALRKKGTKKVGK